LLVAIGIYIRISIVETPEFLKMKEAKTDVSVPALTLFKRQTREVLLGLGIRYVEAACFNIYGVFIFAYVTTKLGLPRSTVLNGVVLACIIMILILPVYGLLADRWGAAKVYEAGALAIGVSIFFSFGLLDTSGGNQAVVWLAIVIPFSFAYPAVYGPQAALMSALFAPEIRYTGISFVYQVSSIFAGGFTVIAATALLQWGNGQPWLICGYIAFAAFVSFVCVQFASPRPKQSRSDYVAPHRMAEQPVPQL
jgi:MHS family metabolite:H+ symporter-like MFS transporter